MANKGKKKVKGRDAAGDKKRTAAGGSGTGMSLKRTLKSIPRDGGRASVMAQKKGGQGKRMMKTVTSNDPSIIRMNKTLESIPFRNSFIERIRSKGQD